MFHANCQSNHRPGVRHSRGSVVAYMLVVLMVMVVGVVMATTNASSVQAQISTLQNKRDQVYYASESGVQRALYEIEYGSWSGTGTYPPLTGAVGNCTYRVTSASSGWNTNVLITSVGTYATDTTLTCTTTVTLTPKNLMPAINLGSNFQENGNITIDGDAQIKGNIDLGGKIAVSGTIFYGGQNKGKNNGAFAYKDPNTIQTPPSVWYDSTGALTPPSNVINVSPMIKAGSGAKAIATANPNTLDFRTATNGVLYYFGDLNLDTVTVYGAGTLVVLGNITIKKGGFGDSLDPVNIVATGDIATQAQFRIYGSVYANGDITYQGQMDITGTIAAQGSMYPTKSNQSGAGGATITRAPPPPFDPRNTEGTGSIKFANFTGPSF